MIQRLATLLITLYISISLQAQDKKKPGFTKEEFRARQEAYLTQKAEITQEEATKFFPIYFELQDRKKTVNDKAWEQARKGKNPKTTDLRTGKLALSMNIIDMIILNHTEYSSHVSTNTCLFAIKDNVITYHMRTDILLVPAHTPGLNNRLYLPVKSHNTLLQCPKIVARSKIFP